MNDYKPEALKAPPVDARPDPLREDAAFDAKSIPILTRPNDAAQKSTTESFGNLFLIDDKSPNRELERDLSDALISKNIDNIKNAFNALAGKIYSDPKYSHPEGMKAVETEMKKYDPFLKVKLTETGEIEGFTTIKTNDGEKHYKLPWVPDNIKDSAPVSVFRKGLEMEKKSFENGKDGSILALSEAANAYVRKIGKDAAEPALAGIFGKENVQKNGDTLKVTAMKSEDGKKVSVSFKVFLPDTPGPNKQRPRD